MKNFFYILFFYLAFCITIACKLQFGEMFPDFWSLLIFLWLAEKSFFDSWWILIIAGALSDFASGHAVGGYAVGYFLGGIAVWFMDNKVYVLKDSRFYVYFLAAIFLTCAYGGFYLFNSSAAYLSNTTFPEVHYIKILIQIAATSVMVKLLLQGSGYAFRFFDKFDRWHK